jgi:hypothetical protein
MASNSHIVTNVAGLPICEAPHAEAIEATLKISRCVVIKAKFNLRGLTAHSDRIRGLKLTPLEQIPPTHLPQATV